MSIVLKPIGLVHVPVDDIDVKMAWGGVEGVVEVFPEYEAGLEGLEEFSHIILITYLHKVDADNRKVLKVRPRRLKRFGVKVDDLPYVGVFCTDSPHRPNPIGISIVELVERKGRFLRVRGLDVFDETPVLDIKAYTRDRRIDDIREPWWVKILEKRIREKLGNVPPII